jgi:deoxyribose-phosphate aldolase
MALPTVPELAAMIDHAVLKPTQTERDVVDACAIARKGWGRCCMEGPRETGAGDVG